MNIELRDTLMLYSNYYVYNNRHTIVIHPTH
jgi:hypothetical protein